MSSGTGPCPSRAAVAGVGVDRAERARAAGDLQLVHASRARPAWRGWFRY